MNIKEWINNLKSIASQTKKKAEKIAKNQGAKQVKEEVLMETLLSVTEIDLINEKESNLRDYLKYDRKCY